MAEVLRCCACGRPPEVYTWVVFKDERYLVPESVMPLVRGLNEHWSPEVRADG